MITKNIIQFCFIFICLLCIIIPVSSGYTLLNSYTHEGYSTSSTILDTTTRVFEMYCSNIVSCAENVTYVETYIKNSSITHYPTGIASGGTVSGNIQHSSTVIGTYTATWTNSIYDKLQVNINLNWNKSTIGALTGGEDIDFIGLSTDIVNGDSLAGKMSLSTPSLPIDGMAWRKVSSYTVNATTKTYGGTPPSVVDFVGSPLFGNKPLSVNFQILDPQNEINHNQPIELNFGDDNYAEFISDNITYTYNKAGNFTVAMYYIQAGTTLNVAKIEKLGYIQVSDTWLFPVLYNSILKVKDAKTLQDIHYSSGVRVENLSVYVQGISPNQTKNGGIVKTTDSIWIPFGSNEINTEYNWTVSSPGYLNYSFNSKPFGARAVNLIKSNYIPPSNNSANATKLIVIDNYNDLIVNYPQFKGLIFSIPSMNETVTLDNNGMGYLLDNPKNTSYNYQIKFSNGTVYSYGVLECKNDDICQFHKTIYNPVIQPTYNESVYIYATDALTGGNIYPYDVAVLNGAGFWNNYTVYFPAGILTPHYNGVMDDNLNIYVSAENYVTSNVFHLNKLTGDQRHDLVVPLYKEGTLSNFTNWYITTTDGLYNTPLKGVNVSVFEGLTLVISGTSNNAGSILFNVSNTSSPTAYNVYAYKENYQDVYKENIYPAGSIFNTYISMYPNVVVTTQPTVTTLPTPNPTPTNNVTIYSSTCRSQLDWNNETIWSPILNIEACVGIVTPIYQTSILTALTCVIVGILFARKSKKLESFLMGALIALTICAITALIDWILWGLIFISVALVYLVARNKENK